MKLHQTNIHEGSEIFSSNSRMLEMPQSDLMDSISFFKQLVQLSIN